MITSNYSCSDILSQEDLSLIHKNSMKILKEHGLTLKNEKAEEVFRNKGIKVDNDKVYLDESTVREALAQIPETFILKSRNPDNDIEIGKKGSALAPSLGAPFIIEDNQKRYAASQDYVKLTKLLHESQYLDCVGEIVSLKDVEEDKMYKKMFLGAAKYSDKCIIGGGTGAETLEIFKMAEKIFGKENFHQNFYMLNLAGALSPLVYDEATLETIMNFAHYSQPLAVYSQILSGVSGPATLAGTLTLQNAEVLTGMVLTQLISPGTPVLYGSFTSAADMNSGDITVGNGQYSRIVRATANLADYYKVPSVASASITDSEGVDFQAGIESTLNFMSALGSGVDVIFSAIGCLDNYNCVSYEKIITDLEMLRFLDSSTSEITVNQDTIATDTIMEIGDGGNYLTSPHTLNQLKEGRQLGRKYSGDNWKNKIEEMLAAYEKPELPPQIEEDLLQFID